MPEPEIIRYETIVVEETNLDDKGNLFVIDKQGAEHKVNKKHEALHNWFRPGVTVRLGIAKYMDREYIHTAEALAEVDNSQIQFKEGAQEQFGVTPSDAPEKPPVQREAPQTPQRASYDPTGQERGMWWKELGEWLRI